MMLANFDPKGDRKLWLELNLDVFMKFAPQEFDREGHADSICILL